MSGKNINLALKFASGLLTLVGVISISYPRSIRLLIGMSLLGLAYYIFKTKLWAIYTGIILSIVGTIYTLFFALAFFSTSNGTQYLWFIGPATTFAILILLIIGLVKNKTVNKKA